jgi:hypothetical protein
MELYPITQAISRETALKPKKFLKYFPKELFGSEIKNGGYHIKERFHALNEFKWVQYNSDALFKVLSVDIDNSSDSLMYQDYNLPIPTWIIQTDKGFQYHWALKNHIALNTQYSNKLKKIIKNITNNLVCLLDGDYHAMGFNRVFRNPINNRTWFSGNEVHLSDFYDLPTAKDDWLNKVFGKIEKQKDLFNNTYSKEYEFSAMNEGDGRNCALFDTLRRWSYAEAKQGSYSEFELVRKAEILNYNFGTMLEEKEVMKIVNSIDWFIENKYNKGFFMSLTKEQRKKIASENGKKSGDSRSKIARTKILATLNTMEAYEIKITVSELARRSKTSPKTVRPYLKEMGYKEISRKEGWKK